MAEQNLQCPSCGQSLIVTAPPGQVIQCTNCRTTLTVPQPPPGTVGYATPSRYYGAPLSNGAATFSLICGILFFVFILINVAIGASGGRDMAPVALVVGILALLSPILALILGIVGLVKTKNPRVGGKGKAIAGISLGGAALLLMLASIPILLPSLNRAREVANRVKCAANLKQIGLALQLYSNENRGRFPDGPEGLLLTQDITPEVFVCPSTNDSPAPGVELPKQAANLQTGGHDSYVYLGKGKTATTPANVVLVYEIMNNHHDGFNALFGDGHVEFIGGPTAKQVQAELQSGQNPPPSGRGF
jgi:prepilin-type processing-associated H-X9-DG protein